MIARCADLGDPLKEAINSIISRASKQAEYRHYPKLNIMAAREGPQAEMGRTEGLGHFSISSPSLNFNLPIRRRPLAHPMTAS